MNDVSPPQPAPKLLDQVRAAIRLRHHSRRTEDAYVGWIRRFILFHRKRHPRHMGHAEVTAFLNHLAVGARVSASTQNQALAALLFLYRDVLGMTVPPLEGLVRAHTPHRVPVALTREEVRAVLAELRGTSWRRFCTAPGYDSLVPDNSFSVAAVRGTCSESTRASRQPPRAPLRA